MFSSISVLLMEWLTLQGILFCWAPLKYIFTSQSSSHLCSQCHDITALCLSGEQQSKQKFFLWDPFFVSIDTSIFKRSRITKWARAAFAQDGAAAPLWGSVRQAGQKRRDHCGCWCSLSPAGAAPCPVGTGALRTEKRWWTVLKELEKSLGMQVVHTAIFYSQ